MKMILLNEDQSNQVRGNYGKYSALEPIRVVEGFALPIDVLEDSEFLLIKEFLLSLPQQEVTIIPDEEII